MIKKAKCGDIINYNIIKEEINDKKDDNSISFGFINIAGLKYKTEYINKILKEEEIDVLGMAETWLGPKDYLKHIGIMDRKDDTEIHKRKNCQNLNRRGMITLKNPETRLNTWKTIDGLPENFIGLKIQDIQVIFVYFPPGESEKYIILLKEVIDKLYINKGIILGDFNVRGQETYNQKLPTLEYENLENVLMDSGFLKSAYINEEFPTFVNRSGSSTPDHIFIKNLECQSEIVVTTTISDHFLIKAKLSLSYTIRDKNDRERIRDSLKPTEYQINNNKLIKKYNKKLNEIYKIELLKNKIDIDIYDNILSHSIKLAFKSTFKKNTMIHRQTKNTNNLVSDDIKDKIKIRNRLKSAYVKSKNFDILIKLREIQNEIKELLKKEKTQKWIKNIRKLNNLNNSDLLKKVSRINKIIPNIEKNRIPDEEIIQNILPGSNMEYDINKLESAISINDIDVITIEELNSVIDCAPNGKAPGLSGITNELIKISDKNTRSIILEHFNTILRMSKPPKSWNQAITIAIPKRDGGHRPITLLENFRKMFERIIYSRLLPNMELCNHQLGFIKNRSTYQQVLNLELLINKMKCNQLTIAFLDIKKAYDMTDRVIMWNKFESYNKDKNIKYLPILRNMFDNMITRVIVNRRLTKGTYMERGLVQGSVLSPILFNMIINDFNKAIENDNINNITTTTLSYADDICIISKTARGMITALKKAEKHSKINHYTFNTKKCVILTKSGISNFTLYNENIPIEETFLYLGIIFSIYGIEMKKQVERNIQIFHKRKYIILKNDLIVNNKLNISKRIMLVKSFLISTIEYGLLFTHRTKHYADLIQKEKNRILRFALGLKKFASTERIKWLTNTEDTHSRNIRLFQKLIDGITSRKDTNELLFKLISEQDSIAKSRKSKLLNITKLGNINDRESISRINSKKIIQRIENFPENIWMLRYLAKDLNFGIENTKLRRFCLNSINDEALLKEVLLGNAEKFIKIIRNEFLKEAGSD